MTESIESKHEYDEPESDVILCEVCHATSEEVPITWDQDAFVCPKHKLITMSNLDR